jgi:N-acetylglucosamine malate deacetylase 1
MAIEFSRVLVLSPHPDDGEITAGGTICRFIEEGMSIFHVIFSSCEASVPKGLPGDILRKECIASARQLEVPENRVILLDYDVRMFPAHRQEILDDMVRLNKEIRPNLILIPSSNDVHQDHQVVHNEAIRAFKTDSSIWGYEHPWNNLVFSTDVFVKLGKRHIDKKIKALAEYKSQNSRPYFDKEYIRALAYTRGLQVHSSFAEAFELSRLIVDPKIADE